MAARATPLEAQLAEARAEVERLTRFSKTTFEALRLTTDRAEAAERERDGFMRECDECSQIAGKALCYPWFKDDQENFPGATEDNGVCIGEHVPSTIVAELARAFAATERERDRYKAALEKIAQRWPCDSADTMRRLAKETLGTVLPPPALDGEEK